MLIFTNLSRKSAVCFITSLAVTATVSTLRSPVRRKPCRRLFSSTNSHFLPKEQELKQTTERYVLDYKIIKLT